MSDHRCQDDNGDWRPCPADLCEANRLLNHHQMLNRQLGFMVRKADLLEAEKQLALAQESASEWQAAARGHVDTIAGLNAKIEQQQTIIETLRLREGGVG